VIRRRLQSIDARVNLTSRNAWQIRFALWGGALAVGLAASLFAIAADHANGLFTFGIGFSPWLAFILCPGGLMLVSWLTRHYFPGTQGSGIPQVLASLEVRRNQGLRSKVLSMRIAFGKMLLTLLGLMSGASIGREGPTVHVGASIMFALGRRVEVPPHYLERALILGGGAAGIAAAFNTPIAGVVFAIEELSRSFEEKTNGIVLTAVILAGITAQAVLGNYNYFGTSTAAMERWQDWFAIPVCGVVGGLLGGLFSQLLITGSERIAPLRLRYPMYVAAGCGLAIAVAGFASGNLSYGTGYGEAREIIASGQAITAGYPFYKFFATVASYLSGIPGGIFAPSLATGAGVGANLAPWFPHLSPQVFIMLGMVGYFVGVVQTPLTGFIIVMEMTDDHTLLLPLMATAFIAFGVSRLVCRKPIYVALARAFLAPPGAGTEATANPVGESSPEKA
jgi:chloride channel protein, CIC family